MPIPAIVYGVVIVGVWARKVYKTAKLLQLLRHAYALAPAAKNGARAFKFSVQHWDDAKGIVHVVYEGQKYTVKLCDGVKAAKDAGAILQGADGLMTVQAAGGGAVPGALLTELQTFYQLAVNSQWAALYASGQTGALAKEVLTTAIRFFAPW